jgi:hypothetical protein
MTYRVSTDPIETVHNEVFKTDFNMSEGRYMATTLANYDGFDDQDKQIFRNAYPEIAARFDSQLSRGWTDAELAELADDEPLDEIQPVTLDDVMVELAKFRAEHTAMVEQVQKLIASVEPYIKDIAPMIDAIANNPMFKMFTGTKGSKK